MLVVWMCLDIRTQDPVQIFRGFWGGGGAYWNLLMFQFLIKWNKNWHIIEDLYEFLNAHLALFGQEIA